MTNPSYKCFCVVDNDYMDNTLLTINHILNIITQCVEFVRTFDIYYQFLEENKYLVSKEFYDRCQEVSLKFDSYRHYIERIIKEYQEKI